MPITIQPVSRRRFLGIAASSAAALLTRRVWADAARRLDPYRFALLSDPHINADAATLQKTWNMSDQLTAAIKQITAMQTPPSGVFINGDCAHKTGEVADYAQFLKLLGPITQLGLPIYCGLGNHDDRDKFWSAAPKDGAGGSSGRLVEDKHMLIVRTPRANWIVLDTLDVPTKTPGRLGEQQIEALKNVLDNPDDQSKPALIIMHHNPEPTADPASTQPAKGIIGLLDTKPLFDVILPRKQVKAVFFGHMHRWQKAEIEGVHFVNLPAIGYPFDEAQPTGWIDIALEENGAKATLNTTDPKSPKAGDVFDLKWR